MSKTCGTVLLKTTDPKALEELSKKRTEKVYVLQNGWLSLTDEESRSLRPRTEPGGNIPILSHSCKQGNGRKNSVHAGGARKRFPGFIPQKRPP